MNIYEITSWAVGYTQYPWVSGWGPLSNMPFFDVFPPAVKNMKMRSWKLNKDVPGLQIDPGGKVWSDVMGCGGGPPYYFISEKILNYLIEEGIPFLRATEMPISKNLSKNLQKYSSSKILCFGSRSWY